MRQLRFLFWICCWILWPYYLFFWPVCSPLAFSFYGVFFREEGNSLWNTEPFDSAIWQEKNIVNIFDGVRLGVIYEPNLSFDPETGRIEHLFLGGRNGFTGMWSEKNSLQIPGRPYTKSVRKW